MDREQEDMQFLGLFGIYSESYKIIITWRKIFSQITLALILPLSFIFLAHIEISRLLFTKIIHNESELDKTKAGTQKYEHLSDIISSEWTYFWLFRTAYFTVLLIFSLLSTSAVVYTIACVYTARDVTFKKVISVVPKVWKRLIVTFLCTFLAFFFYNLLFLITLILWFLIVGFTVVGPPFLFVILILYVIGFVYMTIVWQLASVISVLEDSYGVKAMMKSKELIIGNMRVAIFIFFKLILLLVLIQAMFEKYVVNGQKMGFGGRLGFGLLCFMLLFKLILFGLVVQTVIYFVCKSYHHQNIDKSTLSDHLEVYLGDYVPLKAMDVQLEQFHV